MGREARVTREKPKTERAFRNVRESIWTPEQVQKALLPQPKKRKDLSIVKLD